MRSTTFRTLAFAGLIGFSLVLQPAAPVFAAPEDVSVTPIIINQKVKARDIIKQTITVTNTSNRKLNLYPSVYDVSPSEGTQEFVKAEGSFERSVSLANWIELSRGILELGPGEEKIIPFTVRTHLDAPPATYHARIVFSEGTTRESAEEKDPLVSVLVNIEVQPDIKEVLQLNTFFTETFFLAGDDVLFNFQVENIGNQELKPTGEIRIYDRKGAEVASVPVNESGATFSPEQTEQLASVWTAARGFGKYKAFLNIDYGASQRASIQDTVYFWIVPWKQLTAFFVVSILLMLFMVFYYHRHLQRKYTPHLAPSVAAVDPDPEPEFEEEPDPEPYT